MLDALAAATRALLYAGVLSGAGAVLAESSLRRVLGGMEWFAARLTVRGAAVTIAAALVAALLLVFRLGGQFDEPTLSAVFLSDSGAASCFQLAGAVLILFALGDDGTDRAMRLFDAALVMASFAVCGHAADAGGLESLVAFLHVSAAAWWVGSLWLLRHACLHADLATAAALVRRFSGMAMWLVAMLALAGLVLLLVLVDFTRRPLGTPYGRVLAFKIAIVVLVLGLASYNRFRLTPRLLAGDKAALLSLRQSIDAELLGIGAVLATTAILTTYTSPPE
jgi:putative copper export protein